MKIIAFGATSSSKSINKILASYASLQLKRAEVEVLDLNDYEIPLFSEDKERELGQPNLARNFLAKLKSADAIVISYAEHNGSYTAAFKNLFDWASRITRDIFSHKPMILLSTSPGPGGAKNVLQTAVQSAPYFAGDVKASLSIPNFYENFDQVTNELKNAELRQRLLDTMAQLQRHA